MSKYNEEIEACGYHVKQEIRRVKEKCEIFDDEGYLYFSSLDKVRFVNIRNGKLSRFGNGNPYTIKNINKWLENKDSCVSVNESEVYKSGSMLRCSCSKHGDFKSNWGYIMTNKGHGCKECGMNEQKESSRKTLEKVIEDFTLVHGNRYDYSKVEYKKGEDKVCIICKEHGEFWQTANGHKSGSGCTTCARNRGSKYSTDKLIKAFRKIHGDKYEYKNLNFRTLTDKVYITCKLHGDFLQQISKHKSGNGCPTCGLGRDNIHNANKNEVEWKKIQSGVYVLKLYNENEIFYKIGIASNGVKARYPKGRMPYNYEVIYENTNISKYDACYIETNLKHLNKHNKYIPKIKFKGDTECFSMLEEYDYENIDKVELCEIAKQKREDFELKLVYMYCSGKTFEAISKEVNFSKPFVVNIVTKKHGVEKCFKLIKNNGEIKLFKRQKDISEYYGIDEKKTRIIQKIYASGKVYTNDRGINMFKPIEGIRVEKAYMKNGELYNVVLN